MKFKIVQESKLKLDINKVQSLLREFLEAQIPQGQDKKIKPTFPMDYILFKFPNIKKILTELLTVTFKDYVDNIYVVAPKPTTFKVVLKNKQYFTITYNERSYIVKVEGKKYYMMNLGEKENATERIRNIVNTKKFITSKKDGEDEDEESSSDSKKKTTSHRHTSDGTTLPDAPEKGKEGDDLPDLDSILGDDGEAPDDKDKSKDDKELKEVFKIIK